MHPQLRIVVDDFVAAEERLDRLAGGFSEEWWTRRPDPARWSAAECVAHLNLTALAFLPLIQSALDGVRNQSRTTGRYRRDPIGWLLWRTAGPPVKLRVKTTGPFVPTAAGGRAELVMEFKRLQAEQIECVGAADGLALTRARLTSPFNSRLRYNLYACLTVLPRHQHRHLWQAEQVLEALRRGQEA